MRVIFHHSLTDGGTVESIRKWHVHMNGWRDIGYHYVVGLKGELWKGRDIHDRGAHTGDWRNKFPGVCIIGDFRYYEPNIKQLEACQRIYHQLCRYFGENLKIDYHRRHINPCPGKKLDKNDFEEILMREAPY